MEIYCTRPSCPRPQNQFADLDDNTKLRTVQQKFCMTCGMPLILDNRYLPIKLLGKGGFGAAFLARDRRTPNMRDCVVKQFQPAASLTPDQMRIAQGLFEREAEVLEKLGNRHTQIPDLLAFFPLELSSLVPGQADPFFYIVQEFVDGENMEEELERRGPFSEAEVLEILTEMLKILKFVHQNDSIHRDIKPSNIMRRQDGVLFLLDFGAVKQVTTAAAQTPGQAGKSTGIYSLGFAPPEQMRGDKVYPSTDLYALAVTCLTLLTGKQPDQLHDPFSNTWNWRGYAQVSDRLEAVLNKMLLVTPSERFASAQEALTALGPALTQFQPPPPLPVIPDPVQPNPLPPAPPRPAFTLVEILSSAAFTGFEGGLVAIAVASLLGTAVLSPLFWLILLGVVGGVIFAQTQRWLEKVDLLIIGGVTLLLVWFFPFNLLHKIVLLPPLSGLAQILGAGSPIVMILLIAGFTGLFAIAATAIFRLIHNLMTRLF
jgi:serine/threonine protein kinase